MTFLEKMKNGELYDCSFDAVPKELNKKLYECKELIHDFNMSRPSEVEYRDKIIRKVFAEVGNNCYIEPPFHANWGCNMHVGNNFYSNFNLTVVDDADISNVNIIANTYQGQNSDYKSLYVDTMYVEQDLDGDPFFDRYHN